MKTLKSLYQKNTNIMKHLRDANNSEENDSTAILYSYDLQSGAYRHCYYHATHNRAHFNNQPITIPFQEFYQRYGEKIAEVLDRLGYDSILEVGTGEAVTLANVVRKLAKPNVVIRGIDISYSRIGYGNIFLAEQGITGDVNLGVGNMFELPFEDNSFDIVFTSHCIEPNTKRAQEAITELYRVARRTLVLIEPSYVLGNEATKKHMLENAYCIDLYDTIIKMELNVTEHRLFEIGTYNNQAALIVITKDIDMEIPQFESKPGWACPVCKTPLLKEDGHYFCGECFLIFPVIKNIPCLLRENGILGSKFPEFKS